jgi:light-regulated signal transduction histidine kinase (bacteriophytochrome)
LSALVSSIVSGLRESDPGRSVDISIADGLTAFADPSLMEIVLSNLLGNAWKFTSGTAGAKIEFRAIEKNGKAVYYIRDNGAGFDPQYAEKMFYPFHRLMASTSREPASDSQSLSVSSADTMARHGRREKSAKGQQCISLSLNLWR